MTTPTQDPLNTIPIHSALSFPEGTPIPRIVGKLTHVFGYKSGEGDFGPYTSQSGVIADDSGNKILFTIWNKPSIPEDYMGRTLIFRSGAGKKPSMTLKSDFKDSSKRTLNVTKTCHVLTEEEETDDIPYDKPKEDGFDYKKAAETPKTFTDGQLGGNNPPKANVEPKKPCLDDALQKAFPPNTPNSKPENGIDFVQKRVIQLANLRKICDEYSEGIYQNSAKGINGELIKDVSSCFFIQCVKDGLHLRLPNDKIISKKEDPEKEPEFLPAEEF